MAPTTYKEELDEIAEQIAQTSSPEEERTWRDWMWVAIGLTAMTGLLAIVLGLFTLFTHHSDQGDDSATPAAAQIRHDHAEGPAAGAPKAPTLAQSKGVEFEKFERVDPALPAVPAGKVKRFRVDVMQHVTQVDPELAPTEAWTYTVNGKAYRGSAASPPIVVNEGDRAEITFVNGGSKSMKVTMPHSIDFHSAEVAPSKYYTDIAPGEELKIPFVAKHPGVFMYHCATQPVLTHVANGMAGMMVVKPKGLAPVDRELWITQQEFYLGQPGKGADQAKMEAKTPDVIAFNGYANQYKEEPITVRKGERIRMYVLDAGPSMWSAFHVIGTVFDRTVVEGTRGQHSQTVNLAPSQGGWVEFTLDQEGSFPFVTHAFGDMVNGAAGVLRTENAPKPKAEAAAKPEASAAKGDVSVELGEMFVRPSVTSVEAGRVTFDIKNTGETMHSFAITTDPPKLDGAEPAKSAAIAESEMLDGGAGTTVTADLKPGRYILYCTMGGHYMAGQKIAFTVR